MGKRRTNPFLIVWLLLLTALPVSATDLSEPSNLSAEDLQLRYELVGLEHAFIEAEQDHGVRADFLAAIAAVESGWGRSCFRENNIMGFGGMEFDSKRDCIDHVARFLSIHYLDENGMYYNGETVKGVCVKYNGKDAWAELVEEIMDEIGGDK